MRAATILTVLVGLLVPLAAVSADDARNICDHLRAAGYPAAVIGVLSDTPGLRLQS